MNIKVGILTAPHIDYEVRERTFLLRNVRIGIGFHWDRTEEQEFEGTLEIHTNPDGTQTAINLIDLEDYVSSVISSEMSADSPIELLRAHAIIARSWVLRNIGKHGHYDVCADDHCQRYEGLRRRNERAVQTTRDTRGLVLLYGEATICDCRYHKCCGGRTEEWRTCWEDIDVPYIRSVECPWCGQATTNAALLSRILTNYDRETTDWYRWQVQYTPTQLGEIYRTKSGHDLGDIIDLVPLHRGPSGRIDRLRVIGTRGTEEIGKELTIRLYLSPTCLYSSNFTLLQTTSNASGFKQPQTTLTLSGAGWGHGAGLCQIGAAQMAEQGYTYAQILTHYYPGSRIGTTAQSLS